MTATRVAICCATIATGLTLRSFGYAVGFPFLIVEYGGSLLWATMVYFLVALAFPRLSTAWVVATACLIAISIEFFRLVHTPALDAFRLTTPGALLLGRIFSLWNIPAYAIGVLLASIIDRLFHADPAR